MNRTREDQEETRAYSRGQAGPHPHIRQELLDAEGNLRAQDIGISWQDGETFLHGVRIMGQRDAREEGPSSTGDSGTIPVVSEGSRGRLPPTGDVDTVPTESRTTARVHRDVGHTGTPLRRAHARKDVPAIDRQHPYSGLIAKTSGGRRGFVISRQ